MSKALNILKEPKYSKVKSLGMCVVVGCENKGAKQGKYFLSLCYKHKRQKQKIDNPVRYYYDARKQNAKRRNKTFELTIEEFKAFCDKHNFIERNEKLGGTLTIDRIRDFEGYHKDNIQVLSVSQNSRKYWVDLKIQLGRYPTKDEIEELYLNDPNNIPLSETEQQEEIDPDEVPF